MLRNVRMSVTASKSQLPKINSALKILESEQVLVGVPENKTDRDSDDGMITNAALAYIHNNGSPANNIPARPFIEPGISDGSKKITSAMKTTGQNALEKGNPNQVHQGLEAVGLIAQAAIRNKLNTGPFQALKPATIRARKRRGRTSEKPLIDTAQLRNSINYVIRKAK